jgi:putative flippase GtrA
MHSFTAGDSHISFFLGALTALFAFLTVTMITVDIPTWSLFLVFAPPVMSAGVAFSQWLSHKVAKFFGTFGKYVAVGFLSAGIDFAMLNTASLITGITAGVVIGWVNAPGFIVATSNAYFWNKYWVFGGRDNFAADFPRFMLVTIVGFFLNSAIIIAITTYISPLRGFSAKEWLNIAKVVAGAAVIAWSFTGYRKYTFRNSRSR